MLISHKTRRPDPFHLFLTDGTEVGKCHLVRAVFQTVNNLFCRGNQSQDLHILVCAPTGAATYNISGYTLHAAFLLPVNVRNSDDYIPLSGERLAALKETIENIKVVIIDEISMVGYKTNTIPILIHQMHISTTISDQYLFFSALVQFSQFSPIFPTFSA
jgi:DNA replication protein DnaC